MLYRLSVAVLGITTAFFGNASFLLAQDEVYVRGKEKPLKVNIKAESGLGLEQDLGKGKGKELIPAEDIIDVLYNLTPDGIRVNVYRPAFTKERKYFDTAPHKDQKDKITLAEIIKAYAEALPQVKEKFAKRHLEFKIAYLSVLAVQEEGGGDLEPALQKLATFKSAHPDSWQIAACLRLLAGMQIGQEKFKEAEDSYRDLAAANVAPEVKLEGELLAAQTALRSGKGPEAAKRFDEILTKLPKDSKLYARARIAKAESLASQDKNQAMAMLRQIIKESADKNVKAAAYNALGEIYFQAAAYKESRWEFLHVDVLYNQDRNEHARALYYLSQAFDKLGEAERAKECREALIGDRQFAGLEWQRRASQAPHKSD